MSRSLEHLPAYADATSLGDPNELRLWICPHRMLTYDETLRLMIYRPPTLSAEYHEPVETCGRSECRKRLIHEMHHDLSADSPRLTLETAVRLTETSCGKSTLDAVRHHFTAHRIAKILSNLHLPICKHKDASHLAKSFEPLLVDVKRLGSQSTSGSYAEIPVVRCSVCLSLDTDNFTAFRFHAAEFLRDGHLFVALDLQIWRDLGDQITLGRQNWMVHAFAPRALRLFCASWDFWNPWMERTDEEWTEEGPQRFWTRARHSPVEETRRLLRRLLQKRPDGQGTGLA
jgi:hypothetical protein